MKRKKLIICLFVVAYTALFIAGCKQETMPGAKPPEVICAKVITQKITDTMTVIGQVKSLEKVELRARVKGFLTKRNFKEGSYVKKNELLFQIEKDEYEAQVESAKAELMTADAELKNRMVDYNRQAYLVNKDAVAKRNYDFAEAEKTVAEAKVLTAKANLKEAQLNLDYTNIYAPFAGRIGKATYSVGNVVGAESEPLATVMQIDPIGVEFNLNEALIVNILQFIEKSEKKHPKKSGSGGVKYINVNLELSNNTNYPITGKIDFLNNEINSMTGTILVRAKFDNPNFILVPGAYVKVKISSKYKEMRMLLPQAAIQSDQTGDFVLLVNSKNVVEKRNIKTTTVYGTDSVVLEGVKKGDNVIVEGLQKVREGMKVTPVEEKVETPAPQPEKVTDTKDKIRAVSNKDKKDISKSIEKLQNRIKEQPLTENSNVKPENISKNESKQPVAHKEQAQVQSNDNAGAANVQQTPAETTVSAQPEGSNQTQTVVPTGNQQVTVQNKINQTKDTAQVADVPTNTQAAVVRKPSQSAGTNNIIQPADQSLSNQNSQE